MAEVGTVTVKVNVDSMEFEDALCAERMWYLAAFELIEPYLEQSKSENFSEGLDKAISICRNRIDTLRADCDVFKRGV